MKDVLNKIGFYELMENAQLSSVFGVPYLHKLTPIKDKAALNLEYDNIDKFLPFASDPAFFNKLSHLLSRFRDIRPTFIKCSASYVLDEVELYEIKNFAIISLELQDLLKAYNLKILNILNYDLAKIISILNPAGANTYSFYIYEEYSLTLKNIRKEKASLDKLIFKEKNLELQKKLFKNRLALINEEKTEEYNIRKLLTNKLLAFKTNILEFITCITKLDLLLCKAKLALDFNMCRPKLVNTVRLSMKNGVHPIIKAEVIKKGGSFYPISITLESGCSVITGANMGGKSAALSLIALNYLMASMGFFCFSEHFEFCPLAFIYMLKEDLSSIKLGLSSFASEISMLNNIISKAKSNAGIILIDEFARGTNPLEGNSLTKALISYLNSLSSISIITTHYDGVCSYAKAHYQVRGLKALDFKMLHNSSFTEVDFLKLINSHMDYTIDKVDKNTSIPRDALNICSLIGLDSQLLKLANNIYKEAENK